MAREIINSPLRAKERKLAELHEVVTGPELPTDLESVRARAIVQTHEMLETALEIPMAWKGMTFTVTMEKQNLLTAQLALFTMKTQAGIPATLEWNETGRRCVEWQFEDLFALAMAMDTHVRPMVNLQRKVEEELVKAKTIKKVEVLLDEYRKELAQLAG